MAYSYIQYTGNGTQRDFAFAFPYFNTSDIAVTVNGVAAPFTWTNSSTVNATTAPVSGSLVLIRRTTPKSVSPVNFTDGSVLLESDLDTLANFSLYAAQEAIDTANLSIVTNSSGNWEGQSKTIQNVADPVNTQDVATKGWSITAAASALAGAISNAAASATSAAAALASQVAAAASAAAALVSQNAAAASASTTAALLLSFRNVFLGAFASDSAAVTFASANSITLTNGISYENTTTQKVRVYNRSTWADQSADAQTQSANATAAATSAAASAATATTQATSSASSATNSANSATAASTSQSDALASKAAAAASAAAALVSQNAAAASAASVVGNPTGSVQMWPTATAPSGYLMCAGAAVSRTTYAALFAVIGITFGAGDGSTTFNLPNYVDHMPIGAGTIANIAGTGGSKDAVVVSHTHAASVTDLGHSHTTSALMDLNGGDGSYDSNGVSTIVGSHDFSMRSITSSSGATGISVSNANTGVSGTNANLPPYLGINFIIKT